MSSDFIPCPHCGQSDFNNTNYCRHCGKPKHDRLKKKFECPNCGNKINNYSDFCENCGTRISKELNYSFKNSDSGVAKELHLIDCPGCGNKIMDDVNYCRYCGYSFVEYKQDNGGLSLFAKKLKSSAYKAIGDPHCSNCNETHGGTPQYCNRCGSEMIMDGRYLGSGLSVEQYRLNLVNKIIVPLSKHYNVNFRNNTIKDHFNISKEQELHILYVLMEKIKEETNEDIVKLFEKTLKQTKEDYKNLDETIFNTFKKSFIEKFNSDGISAEDVFTIKSSHYDKIETPIVQNKHGGVTKGVATLGFGLIGLAATSGVKTTTETKQIFREGEYIHYQITFNKRAILLKTYNDSSASSSFNSKKGNLNQTAIKYEDIHYFDEKEFSFILESGEDLKCPTFQLRGFVNDNISKVIRTYDLAINNEFIKQYSTKIHDKIKPLLADLINEEINMAKQNKQVQQNTSNVGELEKIVEMYEKGLLTDDEFSAMKQNIINNDVDVVEDNIVTNNNDSSPKFCGNCGAEIIEDSKFCIQCGTKLN